MSFEFEVKPQEEQIVIHLKGRFLGKEAEDFLKEIENNLAQFQDKHLVIDLANLEYIGSQGVGSLTWLSTKYKVSLAAAGPKIQETLRVLKLQQVFKIYPTVKEALDQANTTAS